MNLRPVIFLVPVIALIVVVVMCVFLFRKAENKSAFRRFVFIVLSLAFLLNLIWEVVQMPLYANASFDIKSIAFCALASIADAIMVLLLYFGFAFIYKKPFWVQDLSFSKTVLLMLAGGIGAIVAEMRHLGEDTWAYDKSMPIILVLNVGLSPVLQFMLLPSFIIYVSYKMEKKKIISNKNNG